MKRLSTAVYLSIILSLLLATTITSAQDVHFANVQEMNIWYNPALKTNKIPQAEASFRNVSYPNLLTYNNKAVTIELPLIGVNKDAADVITFADVAAGINVESSTDGLIHASTTMLAFSYAIPLNDNDTYIALGFQGKYSFNQVGDGTIYTYPKDFDEYGDLKAALRNDPYQSGLRYGYFTASVGAAIFHTGEEQQWYAGASIRYFNHPYTEWTHAARLPQTTGIQAGYTTAISSAASVGGYINLNYQTGNHEQIIGATFTHNLEDSTRKRISGGLAYRAGDALIPNIGLKYGASQFALYYEFNVSGIAFNNYHRRAFEVSYRINL